MKTLDQIKVTGVPVFTGTQLETISIICDAMLKTKTQIVGLALINNNTAVMRVIRNDAVTDVELHIGPNRRVTEIEEVKIQ